MSVTVSNRPVEKIDFNQRKMMIEKFPWIVAKHFNLRLNAFFELLQKDDSILGFRVTDYFWRIEYQQRGSPHAHCLVWLENFPSLEYDTAEEYEEVIKAINKLVTCKTSNLSEEDKKLVEANFYMSKRKSYR